MRRRAWARSPRRGAPAGYAACLMDPFEPRVVDLELRFMRLERELGELSRVVADQQRTIEALVLEVRRRHERDAIASEPAVVDERPPHY